MSSDLSSSAHEQCTNFISVDTAPWGSWSVTFGMLLLALLRVWRSRSLFSSRPETMSFLVVVLAHASLLATVGNLPLLRDLEQIPARSVSWEISLLLTRAAVVRAVRWTLPVLGFLFLVGLLVPGARPICLVTATSILMTATFGSILQGILYLVLRRLGSDLKGAGSPLLAASFFGISTTVYMVLCRFLLPRSYE